MTEPTITATTAAEHADAAAEAIRALNRATMTRVPSPGGYAQPGDVDATVGALCTLAERLPQALCQMQEWLYAALDAGRVRHDTGGDVVDAVENAVDYLITARQRTAEVHLFLTRARSYTSHLGGYLPEGDS